MFKYFKNLRYRNKAVRQKAFTILMVISMVFVGAIWVFSLSSRFNRKVKTQANNSLKPFKIFSNSLVKTYNNMTASVSKIPNPKKIIESVTNKNNNQ